MTGSERPGISYFGGKMMTVASLLEPFPYESPDFHRSWHQYLAPKFAIDKRYGDFIVHRKPVLNNLLSFRELRVAGWNNAWNQDLTEERVLDFRRIRNEWPWDYFRMQWSELRDDLQVWDMLREPGYRPVVLPGEPEYAADLSAGMDAYLASLSHSGRRDFQKKYKKAQPLSPELVYFTGGPSVVDDFFEAYFRYHIPYWDKKAGYSYFNDPHERRFIVEWSKCLQASGHLEVCALLLGGEMTSLSMNIRVGSVIYWLLPINTGIHHQYFPGLISLYLQLQRAVDEGVTLFNMGSGGYMYKRLSSNRQLRTFELIMPNPRSCRGRLYSRWLVTRLVRKYQKAEVTIR